MFFWKSIWAIPISLPLALVAIMANIGTGNSEIGDELTKAVWEIYWRNNAYSKKDM